MYGLLGLVNICLKYNYSKIWKLRVKKENRLKISSNYVLMHITNKKLSFDTFTVGNLLNISMEQFN